VPVGADPAGLASTLPRSVDGVYLGTALAPLSGFLKRFGVGGGIGRRLVASWVPFADPRTAALAPGVVLGGGFPFELTLSQRAYVAAFRRAFPDVPAAGALDPLAVSYRDGVEALLAALERGGDVRRALAGLTLASPIGRIHLDRNHQAVAPSYLARIGGNGKVEPLAVVPGVEQSFGGYLHAPASRTQPACVRRTPPAWARR